MIPKGMEKKIIQEYHKQYGHMSTEKEIQALKEQVNIKGMNKQVQKKIRH